MATLLIGLLLFLIVLLFFMYRELVIQILG
jgi:hypothetical protein